MNDKDIIFKALVYTLWVCVQQQYKIARLEMQLRGKV
jgi:hypothetical protein